MKLESVLIKRYRSAREVHLSSVGDFNVFIGKNNSGKSTLLRAIRAFYTCLRRGDVIALDAPIGRDVIDFSNRKTTEPIEITITFSMELAERDSLIRDIAIEAPQLKNAVDGLDPSLRLEISLAVMPPPARFAYTRRLSLVSAATATASVTPGRILFQINYTGARELADKVREARKYATIAEDINKIARTMDEDDFQGIRRGPDESLQQARFNYVTRRILGDTLQESGPTIETLVRQSNSFADFQSGARSLAAKLLDQSATTQAAPLKSPVESFAGEQSSVPQYVLNLIKTIGAMPVLYLTESGAPLNERIEAEMTRIKAAVENTIKGISAEIDKQSQDVEIDWDHQKLKIVPGDVLIDKVCQRFGTRFRKASDGSRLASFMRPTDIDPQIARIIHDLGT